MATKADGIFKQYKAKIIGSIIALVIAGTIPGSIYMHNAWGDDRYVQKAEDLRGQIQAIDNALFEVNQEISFSETEKDKRKYIARKAYYENLKDALKEELKSKT